MGLLDLFDKNKRKDRAREKAAARLTNAYMQGPERMRGADILLEMGDEKAIYGLLKRFTVRASNGVVDEEEKEQVYSMVVGLGRDAVPAIKRFLRQEDQTYYPLRALSAILPEDEVIDIIQETLEALGPDYMRNPERKLHLIQHLAESRHARCVSILLPFLADHDEQVRFQTINALRNQRNEEAREPMLERFCDEEEESLRLRKLIIEVFREFDWDVKGFTSSVEECMPAGFVLDGKGKFTKGTKKVETKAVKKEKKEKRSRRR